MKKLDLGFRSSTRRTIHHLQLSYVQKELSPEEVRKYMEQISTLGVFSDKYGDLIYATPVSASYIDTEEKVLFDDSKN